MDNFALSPILMVDHIKGSSHTSRVSRLAANGFEVGENAEFKDPRL